MIDPYEYSDSFTETALFAGYCVEVHAVIKRTRTSCVREHRLAMKNKFNARWHADALEHLQGAGAIRKVRTLPVDRWSTVTEEPRKVKAYPYNNTAISTRPKVRRPDNSSQYREARA